MPQYREESKTLTGTVSTIKQVMENRPNRQWAYIECDLDTGVPLIVTATMRARSADYINIKLQPGESVTFSRYGSMPHSGVIYLTGSGGTAGYRGGEKYLERS